MVGAGRRGSRRARGAVTPGKATYKRRSRSLSRADCRVLIQGAGKSIDVTGLCTQSRVTERYGVATVKNGLLSDVESGSHHLRGRYAPHLHPNIQVRLASLPGSDLLGRRLYHASKSDL